MDSPSCISNRTVRNDDDDRDRSRRRLIVFLRLATVAFAARVAAQVVQRVVDLPWLPSFERWHSNTIPYGALVVCQAAIVLGMVLVTDAVARGRTLVPRGRSGPVAVFGYWYLSVMVLRLLAGFTIASGHPWLDAPLPTAFHLVLATFAIVWNPSERSLSSGGAEPAEAEALIAAGAHTTRLARNAVYPVVTTSACATFVVLDRAGLSAGTAAQLTVIASALVIVLAEMALPYRRSWRPDRAMVATDLAYMGVVQMALPAVMAVGFAFAARRAVGTWGGVQGLWPHRWPIVLQIVLVVVVADLVRYWLHRTMHRSPALWRLHAVHHSPDRLYTVNVGRFHPVEEMLQSIVDALPFVLLGVDDRVLAGYFVFYAVNGFFQHANVDVRLGALNHVIAGPELHRWHHSADLSESQHNYGNKLIVWDSLFGTRYLPDDREVDALGIGDGPTPHHMTTPTIAATRKVSTP